MGVIDSIDYGRFQRLLLRSAEIAAEAGMQTSVIYTYRANLQPAAETYQGAYEAVRRAEAEFLRDNQVALPALGALDEAYKRARAVALSFVPGAALAEGLKSPPADVVPRDARGARGARDPFDALDALDRLFDLLDDHCGEAWADGILQSPFGRRGATAIRRLHEMIAADQGLSKAREARAAAFGPAHERYLGFKRAVRDALGPQSWQYKRIHLRADGGEEAAPATVPEPAVQRSPFASRPAPLSDRMRSPPAWRRTNDDLSA